MMGFKKLSKSISRSMPGSGSSKMASRIGQAVSNIAAKKTMPDPIQKTVEKIQQPQEAQPVQPQQAPTTQATQPAPRMNNRNIRLNALRRIRNRFQ